MSGRTSIEWARNEDGSSGMTWNPVRGCKKISQGCDHCYAERFAERWRGVPGHPYEAGFDPRFVPEQLDAPLHWKTPRTVFVNSMSDLFQGAFTSEQIAAVFGVMAQCPRHVFQVLTKRSERLVKWHRWVGGEGPFAPPADFVVTTCAVNFGVEMDQIVRPWPLPNVWQGVSVENRDCLSRLADLKGVPARVRFLSLEPLLEDLGDLDLSGIHWVIVGGESGPGARPMDPAWARKIRDQCEAAGVPFFFKQWGGLLKKKAGRELDGRTHDAMPARIG